MTARSCVCCRWSSSIATVRCVMRSERLDAMPTIRFFVNCTPSNSGGIRPASAIASNSPRVASWSSRSIPKFSLAMSKYSNCVG